MRTQRFGGPRAYGRSYRFRALIYVRDDASMTSLHSGVWLACPPRDHSSTSLPKPYLAVLPLTATVRCFCQDARVLLSVSEGAVFDSRFVPRGKM